MTSYDTGYNRDLARSQRLYDYANIKNDMINYNMGPTHQGGGMSGGEEGMGRPFSDIMKGGRNMNGCGFFDDVLSGISKVGQVVSDVAPAIETGMNLYNKFGKKGKGMSGGVRRGAELADIASPSGQFSVVAGRRNPTGSGMSGGKKLVKGSPEAKAYMASIRRKKGKGMSGGANGNVYGMPELLGRTTQALEGRGGTDGFPSGFKDNNMLAMTGGQYGCGQSGGAVPLKQQLAGILDDRTTGRGMSGGDFWSDFGDGFVKGFTGTLNVASKLLPFIGLGEQEGCGMSGGNVASELALMSGSTPMAEAFLGGRHPSMVPKDEKVMLMKKALADYAMMRQLHKHIKASHGRGKLTITHGAGLSGGGIMEPAVSGEVGAPRYSYGEMADTAGKSNVGSGGGKSHRLKLKPEMYGTTMMSGAGLANNPGNVKMGRGQSGGQLSHEGNMAMADAMGDIFSGMGESGGASERAVGCGQSGGKRARLVKGSPEAKAYMASIRKKKGRGMSGGGMSGGDDMGGFFDGLSQTFADLGQSGPAPPLGITGKGMSGGDFWDDLGNIASAAAPFIEMMI